MLIFLTVCHSFSASYFGLKVDDILSNFSTKREKPEKIIQILFKYNTASSDMHESSFPCISISLETISPYFFQKTSLFSIFNPVPHNVFNIHY